MGPNPSFVTDPLVGFSATFTTSFGDGFLFVDDYDNVLFNGAGPFRLTTAGALPDGLLALTDYWIGGVGGGQLALATSAANALASTFVSFNDDGSGIHTITYTG